MKLFDEIKWLEAGGPGSGRHPSLEHFDKHAENVEKFKDSQAKMADFKHTERRLFNQQFRGKEFDRNFAKQKLPEIRQAIRDSQAEHDQLKSSVAAGNKLAHPEAGQFTRQADKAETIGGYRPGVYQAPSGDTVQVNHFAGWPMQRVAASSSVEYKSARTGKGYKASWSGKGARDSATRHLANVFGV